VPGQAPGAEFWRERLERAAGQLRAEPYGLRGVELYLDLARMLPGHRPADAPMLRLLRRLVWGFDDPDVPGALEIARRCPPALVTDAGLRGPLIHRMTHAARIDRERVELARTLLGHEAAYALNSIERAIAELLVSGYDAAQGTMRSHTASERVRELLRRRDVSFSPELRDWAEHQLAAAW
jgi:hypothetical protein